MKRPGHHAATMVVGQSGVPGLTNSSGPADTVVAVSPERRAERYRAALRRRLIAEFVERWGVCERGHVLTDLNRDGQGRCWCCTRGYERAFETAEGRHVVRETSWRSTVPAPPAQTLRYDDS